MVTPPPPPGAFSSGENQEVRARVKKTDARKHGLSNVMVLHMEEPDHSPR